MNIAGIEVEELEVEEIELFGLEDPDPRLESVSVETKLLIAKRFGGDFDLAVLHAHHADLQMPNPPFWVSELVHPRSLNGISRIRSSRNYQSTNRR